ncbi:hypothetical protein PCYB_125510 [Plasmodium cynomolgi strain B]|uniref:Uncharacterized protein n=1 Tax=Plasmodium cynomolgi (strain B) TaxID=1120755 RepID=K6UZB4_PLACD|nr:hypothetical protein PCYB_125510 [Plasmodium cynomolgi strain B]GAB67985.1 hypothetical protein PCYB_125510 [Plasmodium cynomolgi strain B]
MEKEKLLYEKIYPAINAHRFHFNRLCNEKNIKSIVGEKKFKDSHHVVILSSNFQTKKTKADDSQKMAHILHLSEKGKLFVSFIFLWKEKELEQTAHCLTQLSTTAVIQTLNFYHIKFNINRAEDHQLVYIVTDIEIDADLIRPVNEQKGSTESNMRKLTQGVSYHATTPPMVEGVIEKLIEKFCALMNELLSDGYSTVQECAL